MIVLVNYCQHRKAKSKQLYHSDRRENSIRLTELLSEWFRDRETHSFMHKYQFKSRRWPWFQVVPFITYWMLVFIYTSLVMRRVLQSVFKAPIFKTKLNVAYERNLFSRHILETPSPVRFGLVIASAIYAFIGQRSIKIPILKKLTIPFHALVEMYSMQKEDTSTIEGALYENKCLSDDIIYDEIVIGSGPGGALAASVSINKGNKVLLLEYGEKANKKIPHHSAEQLVADFAYGGLEVILGKKLVPFAQGKVLGGGSQVNSGLYHRTPRLIADKWRQIFNSSEKEWLECEESVEESIKVQTQRKDSLGIYCESPILEIARYLNWEHKVIPRWREYNGRNFVHFGMNETVLNSAIQAGLQIMTKHKVKNIRIRNGIAHVRTFGMGCSHEYRARHITVSAGTIESPKILICSGFAKARDITINFHAMTRLVAIFRRAINDLHDIDPHQTWASNYSAKIGAAVSTPQLLAATKANLGIQSSAEAENTGVYYVSTIPKGRGWFLNLFGNIMPFYSFTKESLQEIEKNTKILKQSLENAGAIEVLGNISDPSISTVHIFGSLPLGSSKVLDELGFVKGTDKIVRVCDGSILPSAPAVNPQGPISVLCLFLSRKIHETEWAN